VAENRQTSIVEEAEDVEEVEDVEGAKGRTSSRMGITGAAKFARRSLQNGTRNFNLKNVWQVKESTGGVFACVARKEVSRFCVLGEKLTRLAGLRFLAAAIFDLGEIR
jgi:hypothetical protein